MKTTRWFTAMGSLVLFGSAILHTVGYLPLLRKIQGAAIAHPLDQLLKACWLALSVLFLTLGVIALVARKMERGGLVVLLCAASAVATAVLLLYFLGPFPGVYLLALVALLLLIGGWLQAKKPE